MNHHSRRGMTIAVVVFLFYLPGCVGQEGTAWRAVDGRAFASEQPLAWLSAAHSVGGGLEVASTAEEASEETSTAEAPTEESTGSHATPEDAHGDAPPFRHEISAFGGATRHGSEYGGTIGGEYEYRFTKMLGIAAQAEWTGGDFDDVWVFDGGLTFRPVEPIRFIAAMGWVREHGGEEVLLGRIGTWYSFHVAGHYFVAPSLNLDFIEGGKTETVYGVNVGFGF